MVGLLIGALVFTAPAALAIVVLVYLLLPRPQNPTLTRHFPTPGRSVDDDGGAEHSNVVPFPRR